MLSLFWPEAMAVNLWRYVEEQRQALSQNQFRRLCDREFLSYMRIREWREVHHQLVVSCRQMSFRVTELQGRDDLYEQLHRTLLTGFLGNVAQQDEGQLVILWA